MRVVEYQTETRSLPYQVIKGAAWVSGIFSLVVCILIIANNIRLKTTDPIHSPALQTLVENLKTDPKNEALRDEIRELDYLARRAFFTSQHFNRVGIYLLVGGLVILVVSLKSLESFKTIPPFPNSSDPKDDIVESAAWARKAVTAVGLVLVGFALMIALPWESTLDLPEEVVVAAAEKPAESKEAAPAETTPPAPATPAPAAADAPPLATAEERLENWPGFRGPEGGVSRATGLPVAWDGESGDGIQWKTPLPLKGFSSPLIWKGKIYLTGADETVREVFCVDAGSGEILWRKAAEGIAGSPPEPPEVTDDTGYAAATMATDGVRIFAIFANGDLAAFDLEGRQVWAKNVGVPENPYGHASSLVIYEDLLLVQYDQKKDGFFAGLDGATGNERWRAPRNFGPSWSSPTVFHSGERDEVVLAADPAVVSYDPKTGKELWRVDCLERAEVAPVPVYADGILYASADYSKLSAIDVKTKAVLWENEDQMPGVSTPIVVEGRLICPLTDGGIVCYDAKTGEEVWYADTDDGFYASPIYADGRIYLMDRSGNTLIFKPGAEYELLGTASLGEDSTATPAALGSSLYVRGLENLYRIGS